MKTLFHMCLGFFLSIAPSFYIKWGKSVSQYFSTANGVRQGGILSPKWYALYMNGQSGALSLCKAGCYIDDQCMNHLMYADDICVMTLTAIALQQLLDVCWYHK